MWTLHHGSLLRWSLAVLGFAALVYVVTCGALFILQRSLIYFPQRRFAQPAATTLTLTVDSERILVTVQPCDGPRAVMYFGGNGEDISLSLPALRAAFPDRAIYLLHYRGYGGSSGRPSEDGIIKDALALYARVRSEHPQIVAIGRSLGSGVAVHIASLRPVEGLILVTPYDSLLSLAKSRFPYFPISWLLLDRFESWRYAARVTAPTLLIQAEYDETIPSASTEALYRQFRPDLVRLRVIEGAGHNTIADDEDYVPLLRDGSP